VTFSVAVENPDRGFLASIRLDGSDVRMLVEPPGSRGAAANAAPAVSPDGKRVAFQRAVATPERGLPPFIYLVRLDASRPERRLTRGRAPEVDPAWSPDGRRIAFCRAVHGRFDLFTSAPDGTGVRRLTRTPAVDELGPAWSPDGDRIAFARYQDGPENGSGDLWTTRADGSGAKRLLGGRHDYSSPAWSPDGRRIALVQDGHVAVMDAHGTAPRRITGDGQPMEWRPNWSPDGTRIVFTRDPGTILVVDPDGSHLVEVPFEQPATGAAWEPGA
jgi:Tol biopolymer transport system component